MRNVLQQFLDDDHIDELTNNKTITLAIKEGHLKITQESQYKVTLEINPKLQQDERRQLTRDEISHHLSALESPLTVDDAMRILQELRDCSDIYNVIYNYSTRSQYSLLVHPTNPIHRFESVGKECPVWYKEKYGEK